MYFKRFFGGLNEGFQYLSRVNTPLLGSLWYAFYCNFENNFSKSNHFRLKMKNNLKCANQNNTRNEEKTKMIDFKRIFVR